MLKQARASQAQTARGFGKRNSGIGLEHKKPSLLQVAREILLERSWYTFQACISSSTNSAGQNERTGTVLVPKPLETKALVCSLMKPIW